MTPDRTTIQTAAKHLDIDDFAVWLKAHIEQIGRRRGARELGISEEAWRWRLQRAERIIKEHTRKETAA